MARKKKKRNLIATFEHIERYHRRRSTFIIHATGSLVFQAAMWINWYTSYALRPDMWKNDFFSPRFAISTVLVIILAGHFALMRLTESRDRLVIEALRQHEDELDDYEDADEDDSEDALDEAVLDEDAEIAPMETGQAAAKLPR